MMRFIPVTRTGGDEILLNLAQVISVEAIPCPKALPPGEPQCLVTTTEVSGLCPDDGNVAYAVMESYETLTELITKATR